MHVFRGLSPGIPQHVPPVALGSYPLGKPMTCALLVSAYHIAGNIEYCPGGHFVMTFACLILARSNNTGSSKMLSLCKSFNFACGHWTNIACYKALIAGNKQ